MTPGALSITRAVVRTACCFYVTLSMVISCTVRVGSPLTSLKCRVTGEASVAVDVDDCV